MTCSTYCYNVTGDMTIWQGVAFNRIWRLGHKYYGVNKTGIYELKGNTDNGTPFTSTFTVAPHSFGSMALKRLPYMRVHATKPGTVTVNFEGDTSGYPTEFTDAKRVKLGRGMIGRFGTITVSTTEEGFQLHAIEPFPEVVQRGVK